MAKWVKQSEVPSITPNSRRRTEYLRSLRAEVAEIIKSYVEKNPEAEDVTLEVLSKIGRKRLEALAPNKSINSLKQDFGLFIAQTLVDIYGARRIESLRRSDGLAASTRRNQRKELDWVQTYTPHRVLELQKQIPRIILDTSTVRCIIHGDAEALNLKKLSKLKGEHLISVADGATAELANALLRGSIPLSDWKKNIVLLNEVLDPTFPVAPGGKELAALWGAHPMKGLNLDEMQWYYKSVWEFFCGLQDASELLKSKIVSSPWGGLYTFRLDQQHTKEVLEEAGKQWSDWVKKMSPLLESLKKNGEKINEKEVCDFIASGLVVDMGHADVVKLDLLIRVMAKRVLDSSYNPKTSNDAIDLDLLFGIPLPAIICTNDKKLIRFVNLTTSGDKSKVMDPRTLLEYLENF